MHIICRQSVAMHCSVVKTPKFKGNYAWVKNQASMPPKICYLVFCILNSLTIWASELLGGSCGWAGGWLVLGRCCHQSMLICRPTAPNALLPKWAAARPNGIGVNR